MALITVYAFEIYDPSQDDFVPAKGMVTEAKANKQGWRIIKSISKEVESSLLNENGRYHEDRQPTI